MLKPILKAKDLFTLFKIHFVISLFLFSACSTTNTDLRTLAPKDTLIYLETNNLGKTLNALTDNQSFKTNSSVQPDFSAFQGMQVAIVVTSFETSENKVTDENSVLNFKPKFTAIAETHAWSWQVNSLVENNLNAFVKKNYGNDAKLERKSINDTERFVWTANDGRKTFAVIAGTQVFFGNDEVSLSKCLSAKRGEAESLLKNETLNLEYEKAKGKLAFGFVSNQGIKQIAEIVGVTVAVGQTEDENSRGFIANILPQLLNKSVKEIVWTADKTEKGIVDEIFIKSEKEMSEVLSETIVSSNKNTDELYKLLPPEVFSATFYNLKNPQIAYRSLVLTTAQQTDPINGKIIASFSNSLLSSYGIADAEGFLSAVDAEIITARFDANGDKKFSMVKVKDFEKLKQTIAQEFKLSQEPEKVGTDEKIWNAEDENLSAVLKGDIFFIGDKESIARSLTKKWDSGFARGFYEQIKQSKNPVITISKDTETVEKIVNVLGKQKTDAKNISTISITQTNFSKQGMTRKYVSDFGFLGTIVEQFGEK